METPVPVPKPFALRSNGKIDSTSKIKARTLRGRVDSISGIKPPQFMQLETPETMSTSKQYNLTKAQANKIKVEANPEIMTTSRRYRTNADIKSARQQTTLNDDPACISCNRSHRKCNRGMPTCSACLEKEIECEYPTYSANIKSLSKPKKPCILCKKHEQERDRPTPICSTCRKSKRKIEYPEQQSLASKRSKVAEIGAGLVREEKQLVEESDEEDDKAMDRSEDSSPIHIKMEQTSDTEEMEWLANNDTPTLSPAQATSSSSLQEEEDEVMEDEVAIAEQGMSRHSSLSFHN